MECTEGLRQRVCISHEYNLTKPDHVQPRSTNTKMMPIHSQSHSSDPDEPRKSSITRLTVSIPNSGAKTTINARPAPPSRWRTPEFVFYGVAFVLVVPWLIYWPMRLSSRELTHCTNPRIASLSDVDNQRVTRTIIFMRINYRLVGYLVDQSYVKCQPVDFASLLMFQ
jgi:hypothetical protein